MRGLRNNNPLNIRHSKDQWQGAAETQTDKEFVQFQSMAYGYRAAWRTLHTYYKRLSEQKKHFTVENIISRWAPPTENDTKSYIHSVLRMTSLGGNENLPQPSRGVDIPILEKLVAAMTTMECGIPYQQVNRIAIGKGYELAFPGKRSYARTQPVEEDIYLDDLLMWDEYRDW